MKDTEYKQLIELSKVGGGFIPANDIAAELLDNLTNGEIITVKNITKRDLRFHRAYFALLKEIYGYLPKSFHYKIPEDKFFQFIKHVTGDFEVIFEFKDGTKLIEYKSIAFGKMNQQQFREYVREQLPFIYSEILGKYYEGDMLSGIIDTIEENFERFLAKL